MARRLTDPYFVEYSMVVAGIRTNGVEKDVERNGSGVFVISEYDVSVVSGIHKLLDIELKAEAYDIHHFEDLRKRYNVMSVPCLVINDDKISFGKKNINQVLELIKQKESE